jgi:hypothetical protein
MTYTEKMIEKYADDLTNALSNDLNKACKILTKIFRYATITDAIEVYDDLIVPIIYCSVLEDCFHGCSLMLKGTRLGKGDAWERLSGIMEDLHYDNGLPLSGYNYPADNPTEWNDYFEHYDRDQDFWGFYCSDTIDNFVTDGTNIFIRVDLSLSELGDELINMYDGASWDHDFGRRW